MSSGAAHSRASAASDSSSLRARVSAVEPSSPPHSCTSRQSSGLETVAPSRVRRSESSSRSRASASNQPRFSAIASVKGYPFASMSACRSKNPRSHVASTCVSTASTSILNSAFAIASEPVT